MRLDIISIRAAAIVLLLSLTCSFNPIYGQQSSLFLIPSDSRVEVPFNFINGFIVVEATLNDKHKTNLLVDTGAENLILFNPAIKEEMSLLPGKKVMLKGADLLQEVPAEIVRNIKFKLINTNKVNKDFIILDKNGMNLSEKIGYPIDGLIGGRVFWGLVLEIDYKNHKLILKDKTRFSTPSIKHYRQFDLEIKNHKPYMKASVKMYSGSAIPIKVLLDSGSGLGFMLFHNSHPDLKFPEKSIEGELGLGLGGAIKGYISHSKMLRMGSNLFFRNLITNFQGQNLDLNPEIYNGRNGIIGNPLLSRFKVIIDYAEGKLYLKPNKNYNKALEFDKSGLVVFANGKDLNTYTVKSIIKGSVGEMADIRKGDQIKKINFLPSKFLSLGSINKKFAGKNGKTMRLVIIRDGQRLVKRFRLKDYLAELINRELNAEEKRNALLRKLIYHNDL